MRSLENVGRKPMPKHFTAKQFAASAAVGDLRTQKSFGGDTQAWHTYQDKVYSTLQRFTPARRCRQATRAAQTCGRRRPSSERRSRRK